MPLEVFGSDALRSDIADWVELTLLRSAMGQVSSTALSRSQSVLEDADHGSTDYEGLVDEDVDTEIANLTSESLSIDVLEELRFRFSTLGETYPFELEETGSGWILRTRVAHVARHVAAGRLTYLACLFASALTSNLILGDEGDSKFDAFAKYNPTSVQVLATVAAAALINGNSYWMGWPREDRRTGMLDAVGELVTQIGYGQVADEAPDWSNGYEKDGTVDVVAWRTFADRQWAGPIVFGQVASGNNWRQKSVTTFLKSHFFEWFTHAPGNGEMVALAAMFIPFPLHRDVKPTSKKDFDVVATGRARQASKTYGLVIDRMRMSELVLERFFSYPRDRYIEGHGIEVMRWVRTGRELISASAAPQTER